MNASVYLMCLWCIDSNKKLKDALIEFSGDVGLCRQQDEVSTRLLYLCETRGVMRYDQKICTTDRFS